MKQLLVLLLFTIGFLNLGAGSNKKPSDFPQFNESNWSTSDIFTMVDVSTSSTKKTTVGDFDTRYYQLGQNLQMTAATSILLNGASSSWRLGYNIGALTTPHLAGVSIQLKGAGGATDGIALGTGSAANLEIDNAGKVWANGALAVTGNISAANFGHAPTVQRLTSTGTTTGYLFVVTTANATAGATYTNNSVTFTVNNTISSGGFLFTTAPGAPAGSGTLTKTSGTGDSTITFSATKALATYTPPSNPSPVYIRVKMVGAGGGGGGSCAGSNGGAGSSTAFEQWLVGGGSGGVAGASPIGGTGGTVLNTGTGLVFSAGGQNGSAPSEFGTVTSLSGIIGGAGGVTPLGAGANGFYGGATSAGLGSGSGGGGAGINISTGSSCTAAGGGGAAAYVEALLPAQQYLYAIASTGGALGALSGSGFNGGTGGTGIVIVEEYYQ